MGTIKFKILNDYGSLGGSDSTYFRFIDWNGFEKYDIRRWSEDGTEPFKGITLNEDELETLYDLLEKALHTSKNKNPIHTVKLGKATAKILNTFGSFAESGDLSKQLNYISWGYGAKYDLRPWSEDFSVCGKGLTLTEAQCQKLLELIGEVVGNNIPYGIAFEDFVVRSNTFRCNHGHTIDSLRALISVLRYDGTVVNQEISAGYCRQCNCYFILEADYQRLRKSGLPLCRQITEKTYRDKDLAPFSGEELNPESVLHSVGYNVNATEDLSSQQRRDILSFVVESGLYTIAGVCSHIDWLIDKNSRVTNRNMQPAISKWMEDRAYISKYKIGTRPMVGVRSLKGRSVR